MVLLSWLLGTAVAAVLLGTGRWILDALRIGPLRTGASFAASLAIGAGIYSHLFFALAHLGLIDGPLYGAILGVGGLLALPGLRAFLRDFRAAGRRFEAGRPAWLWGWMAFALALCVLLASVSATAPISDWDSREYHLGLVLRYLWIGRAAPSPFDALHDSYLGQSMLSLWILAIGPDSAAQVLSFWFGAGLLAVTHAMASALYGGAAGLAAAALVSGFAFFAERSVAPTSDMLAAMISVLMLHLALEMHERIGGRGAVLIGLLAAVACASRMISVLFVAVVLTGLPVFWYAVCRLSLRRVVALSALVGAAFLVTLSPWPIRNFLWTGNPVFPLADSLFHAAGAGGELANAARQIREHPSLDVAGWMVAWLSKPMNFVLFGSLVYPLAPLSVCFRAARRSSAIVLLAAVAGAGVISWFAATDRYYVSVAVLAAVLASHSMVRLLAWGGRFATLLAVGIAIGVAGDLAIGVVWYQQFLGVALGLESRDQFLRSTTAFYDDYRWMSENLPPDAQVLVFSRDEYYLDRRAMHFWGEITPAVGLFDLRRYKDGGEFARALREAGVTHVFFTTVPTDEGVIPWAPRQGEETARKLLPDVIRTARLVRHNPQSLIGARRYPTRIAETWVYELGDPPSP